MILGFDSSKKGRPLNKNLSDSWKDSIFYSPVAEVDALLYS